MLHWSVRWPHCRSLGHSQLRVELNELVQNSWVIVALFRLYPVAELVSFYVLLSLIEVALLYMLTQSCYKVKALFRPMDSECLIRATAGGFFFLSSDSGQTSFVGILDPLNPNFVVIINCQDDRLLMALLQWDRTQIYHIWPQHEQVLQGLTSHPFLLFDPSSCFLLSPWPLILSRHHLLLQEQIFISISHCLCSFYGCNLSEFTLSPILGQRKAWSSKINREVQEKWHNPDLATGSSFYLPEMKCHFCSKCLFIWNPSFQWWNNTSESTTSERMVLWGYSDNKHSKWQRIISASI